jgi:hypothetical protein
MSDWSQHELDSRFTNSLNLDFLPVNRSVNLSANQSPETGSKVTETIERKKDINEFLSNSQLRGGKKNKNRKGTMGVLLERQSSDKDRNSTYNYDKSSRFLHYFDEGDYKKINHNYHNDHEEGDSYLDFYSDHKKSENILPDRHIEWRKSKETEADDNTKAYLHDVISTVSTSERSDSVTDERTVSTDKHIVGTDERTVKIQDSTYTLPSVGTDENQDSINWASTLNPRGMSVLSIVRNQVRVRVRMEI